MSRYDTVRFSVMACLGHLRPPHVMVDAIRNERLSVMTCLGHILYCHLMSWLILSGPRDYL